MGTESRVVDPAKLAAVVGLGYTEVQAREALIRTSNDADRAVEYILTHDSLPPLVSVADTEETQVKKAMEESRREQERREMDRATQASLINKTGGGINNVVDLRGDDSEDAMQIVLYESARASDAKSEIPPPMFERKEGRGGVLWPPTGLRNTGNLCYLNSLVQTYFAIPQVRKCVLEWVAPMEVVQPAAEGAAQDAKIQRFMGELQKLFALLEVSRHSYVDPSELVSSFDVATSFAASHVTQQDMGEINTLFLGLLEAGLRPPTAQMGVAAQQTTPDAKKQAVSLVDELFGLDTVEFIESSEEDGTPVVSQNRGHATHLILPLAAEAGVSVGGAGTSICDALEVALCGEAEGFTTPKGRKTTAKKCSWFTHLPLFLFIQEGRVFFNQKKKQFEKVSTALRFEQKLFMDRWTQENREPTTTIRRSVAFLRQEIARFQTELNAIMDFKGRKIALVDALNSVHDYFADMGNKELAEVLGVETTKIMAVETDLHEEIQQRELQISTSYDKQDFKQVEYVLWGVWVHGGSPVSGHYRLFLRASRSVVGAAVWLEFNDNCVSEVAEDVVMKQSTGGNGTAVSASFLLFARADVWASMAQAASAVAIPQHIRDAALAADALAQEKRTKAESSDTNIIAGPVLALSAPAPAAEGAGGPVAQFCRATLQVSRYREELGKSSVLGDPRVFSKWVFLDSAGDDDLKWGWLAEALLVSFRAAPSDKLPSEAATELLAHKSVRKEVVETASRWSLANLQEQGMSQWCRFRHLVHLINDALQAIVASQYLKAAQTLAQVSTGVNNLGREEFAPQAALTHAARALLLLVVCPGFLENTGPVSDDALREATSVCTSLLPILKCHDPLVQSLVAQLRQKRSGQPILQNRWSDQLQAVFDSLTNTFAVNAFSSVQFSWPSLPNDLPSFIDRDSDTLAKQTDSSWLAVISRLDAEAKLHSRYLSYFPGFFHVAELSRLPAGG